MSEWNLEKPVPDAEAEREDAITDPGGSPDGRPQELPLEADEADATEQALGVDLEEDDYR